MSPRGRGHRAAGWQSASSAEGWHSPACKVKAPAGEAGTLQREEQNTRPRGNGRPRADPASLQRASLQLSISLKSNIEDMHLPVWDPPSDLPPPCANHPLPLRDSDGCFLTASPPRQSTAARVNILDCKADLLTAPREINPAVVPRGPGGTGGSTRTPRLCGSFPAVPGLCSSEPSARPQTHSGPRGPLRTLPSLACLLWLRVTLNPGPP